MIRVIVTKLAGYMGWILFCEHCKFSGKICYISENI